jgi:hypothetical protein
MKIILTIEEIIKRCLWSKYKKFVLKNNTEEEINDIIIKNSLIEISENDAFVVGLLKIVETENLIHQFNLHIIDFLKNKSTIHESVVLINKTSLMKEIMEYKDMFPIVYQADANFIKKIEELKIFITNIYDDVDRLNITKINIKEKIYTFVRSNEIQKIINEYLYKV